MGKSVGKREARDREINKEGTVIYMHCKLSERKWFCIRTGTCCGTAVGPVFFVDICGFGNAGCYGSAGARWTVAAVLFLVLTGIGVVEVSYKGKKY